jgi:hypothetical protein
VRGEPQRRLDVHVPVGGGRDLRRRLACWRCPVPGCRFAGSFFEVYIAAHMRVNHPCPRAGQWRVGSTRPGRRCAPGSRRNNPGRRLRWAGTGSWRRRPRQCHGECQ